MLPGVSSPTLRLTLRMPSLRPRKIANARCEGVLQHLVVFEVVAELGAFGFLARYDAGTEGGVVLEEVPQLGQQVGVLGEALHEDVLGAFEHGLHIGEALSASIKRVASLSGFNSGLPNNASASSPRPASGAIWPLVRRFCL